MRSEADHLWEVEFASGDAMVWLHPHGSHALNTPKGKVIIAGFGPVGRAVADQLELVSFQVTVIDRNPRTGDSQKRVSRRCIVGDVTDPDVLKRAGIEQADVLVLAIPDEEAAVRACAVARELSPNIFIAARTNFVSRGLLASSAGAMQQAVMSRLFRDKTVTPLPPSKL